MELVETPAAESLSRVFVAHSSSELYGSDRALLESVLALRERGCAVLVTLPESGPLEDLLERAGAEVYVADTAVLKKSDLSAGGLLKLGTTVVRTLLPSLRLLRTWQPQLVYVNTINIPLWILVSRLSGTRSVCHVHEAEEGISRGVALGLALPLLLCRRVLVNSQSSRSFLLRSCRPLARRTSVVYNGVPGPPAGPSILPENKANPARLVLVGRLAARKGSDIALEATIDLLSRGMPVELRLVGSGAPGMEQYERSLRQRVNDAGVQHSVTFEGFREDVWPSFANADVVLVPSRVEPFGNVAVEAALACRPVIVSRVQGLCEIVTDGVTGLTFDPDSPRALADAVVSMLSDWDRARAMAATAQAEAESRFGVRRYRDELFTSLETAIQTAASGTGTALHKH